MVVCSGWWCVVGGCCVCVVWGVGGCGEWVLVGSVVGIGG